MNYDYTLQIRAPEHVHAAVTSLLEVHPTFTGKFAWDYTLHQGKHDPYVKFFDIFLGLLDRKYDKLETLGVNRANISIWVYYKYEDQCNLEFSPTDLLRLGENQIMLCITCWTNE